MTRAWFPFPADEWQPLIASLPLPLSRAMAIADLEWFANEVRRGTRAKRIGRVALGRRWGWTDRQVRSLLKEGRTTLVPPPHHSRTTAVPPPYQNTDADASTAAPAVPSAHQPHTSGAPAANHSCPHALIEEPKNLRSEEEHTAAHHTADKRQAEQDGQWQALCSRWDTLKSREPGTTAKRLSRSKGQGAELWKMREGQPGRNKDKWPDFLLVLDYIEAGTTKHACNFRDTYDTQPITVRRNVDQWADLAREWRDGIAPTADGVSPDWAKVLELATMSAHAARDLLPGDGYREKSIRSAAGTLSKMDEYRAKQHTPGIRALFERRIAARRFEV